MASKGSLNKVMIIGNFGADPELRNLPDGGSVANFSVATTDTWTDKNTGTRKEQTEWHRVTFFGKLAEIIHQYGRKGGKIYVEGSLRTRKWEDKEGNTRWTTEIRGSDFTFLSSRRDDENYRAGGDYGGGGNDGYQRGGGSGGGGGNDTFDHLEDEDVPF